MNIWDILEIGITKDLHLIKQAYAKKIKKCKPEVDPEGFKILRNAYEIALKYVEGCEISHDLDDKKNIEHHTKDAIELSNGQTNSQNPADTAFQLIDTLVKSEKEALVLFKEFQQKGLFDNLEFTDNFQRVLAINLLAITPGYFGFITSVIDYFDWHDVVGKERNTIFGIALTNLINQVRPFRYLLHLDYLSQIKSKKQAKENNINWNNCYAAKLLLSSAKPFTFYLISFFCRGKKRAVINTLNYITESFPQILGMGVSLSSFFWWSNVKRNTDKITFRFSMMFFIILIIGSVVFYLNTSIQPVSIPVVVKKSNLEVKNSDEQNKEQILETNNAQHREAGHKVDLVRKTKKLSNNKINLVKPQRNHTDEDEVRTSATKSMHEYNSFEVIR